MMSVKINAKNIPAPEQYCSLGCAAFFNIFKVKLGKSLQNSGSYEKQIIIICCFG